MATAPTAEDITSAIIAALPEHTTNEAGEIISGYKDIAGNITTGLLNFLGQVCSDISTSWTTWQAGVIYAGDSVTGSGIGAWVGTGGGGVFDINMSLSISDNFGQAQIMPEVSEFVEAISIGWQTKFNAWKTSYSFTPVSWAGTSTATPITPGVFVAAASELLITHGTAPTGVGDLIKTNMPSFDLDNAQVGDLVDAIGTALETLWATWATNSTVSPSVTGVASAGSGTGSGTSVSGVVA